MSAARKSSSTEREADAPKPGQRTSGWRQSRCSLDSHYVTNHTLTVREGVITQSRAKSPGAPQTSALSLCLIEQFNVMLGTVSRHSIRYHLLSSTFSLSSARRFPNGLTNRAEGTLTGRMETCKNDRSCSDPQCPCTHNELIDDPGMKLQVSCACVRVRVCLSLCGRVHVLRVCGHMISIVTVCVFIGWCIH